MVNALWVVLGGMAIVFTCLGIVLGVMVILNRVFKPEEEEES